MALTRAEINRRSEAKRGIKNKAFKLDMDTIALLERLAAETGLPQVQVLKAALACFDKHRTSETQ